MHPRAIAIFSSLRFFMRLVPVAVCGMPERSQSRRAGHLQRSVDKRFDIHRSVGRHVCAPVLYDYGTMALTGSQADSAVPLVRVASLTKSYSTGRAPHRSTVELFRDLSFTVSSGELLAIVGESGAGKSTLLHLLAALDKPTSGSVLVNGLKLETLNAREQARFRNVSIGYVWQFHYLLPEFTAAENVAMPLLARGVPKAEALRKAEHWLDEVELSGRALHRSGELSGGEQQRVSLARALVTDPKLLLADEPTGDLDNRTAGVVFSLLERLHRTHGLTSVLVTHHLGFAAKCDRTLLLRAGELVETPHSSTV